MRSYFRDYAIAADREVEIRRRAVPRANGGEPGSELDILVQAPAWGTDAGEKIRIPIEVKLSCNHEVRTAMKDQLVDRYVPQLGASHGVYVMMWMSVPEVSHLVPNHRPKWPSIERARDELREQARVLSESAGLLVRSLVVDGSLR